MYFISTVKKFENETQFHSSDTISGHLILQT